MRQCFLSSAGVGVEGGGAGWQPGMGPGRTAIRSGCGGEGADGLWIQLHPRNRVEPGCRTVFSGLSRVGRWSCIALSIRWCGLGSLLGRLLNLPASTSVPVEMDPGDPPPRLLRDPQKTEEPPSPARLTPYFPPDLLLPPLLCPVLPSGSHLPLPLAFFRFPYPRTQDDVSNLWPMDRIWPVAWFWKYSFPGVWPCPFIYILSVAVLCCSGKAEQLQHRPYGPQSLKSVLAGSSQKNFACSWCSPRHKSPWFHSSLKAQLEFLICLPSHGMLIGFIYKKVSMIICF